MAAFRIATVRPAGGRLRMLVQVGPHTLGSDEPVEAGGDDSAPAPHDFLLAALGACISMTLKLYAARKGWPLTATTIELSQRKVDGAHFVECAIALDGPLAPEQRQRLLEIASRCPVHRTLTGEIRIASKLA